MALSSPAHRAGAPPLSPATARTHSADPATGLCCDASPPPPPSRRCWRCRRQEPAIARHRHSFAAKDSPASGRGPMRDCRCRSRCLWLATAASPSALPPSRYLRKKAGGFGDWPPAGVVNEGQQRLLRQFVPASLTVCGGREDSHDMTVYLGTFIHHSSPASAAVRRHDLPVTTNACHDIWTASIRRS